MQQNSTTSISLLLQLREPDSPESVAAWDRFAEIYLPLLTGMARKYNEGLPRPLQDEELADVVQTVFLSLRRRLVTFEPDANKRFRGYLAQTVRNTFLNYLRDHSRKAEANVEFENHMAVVEAESVLSDHREHQAYLYRRCLDEMKKRISVKHWEICQRYFVQQQTAPVIADIMKIPAAQVHTVISRTKAQLRTELEGFLDES